MRYLAVITLLVIALAHPFAAQTFTPVFDAGHDAYLRGEYSTALKHFRPHAERGHAHAQFLVGSMCDDREGVAKDADSFARYR